MQDLLRKLKLLLPSAKIVHPENSYYAALRTPDVTVSLNNKTGVATILAVKNYGHEIGYSKNELHLAAGNPGNAMPTTYTKIWEGPLAHVISVLTKISRHRSTASLQPVPSELIKKESATRQKLTQLAEAEANYGWVITWANPAVFGAEADSEIGVEGPHDSPFSAAQVRKDGREFKMFDGDGVHCYTGFCLGPEAFGPLDDYGAPNAGCTDISYGGKKL